jgi:hypothetical protein
MNAYEPRVRHRGFFLHSTDGNETEIGEHDTAEGVTVRSRVSRSNATPRQFSSSSRQSGAGLQSEDTRPQIRSGSVTGSRQRAHLPR